MIELNHTENTIIFEKLLHQRVFSIFNILLTIIHKSINRNYNFPSKRNSLKAMVARTGL